MTAAPVMLELREVTVDFGGLRALDGVSLGVPAGRITGLIGPNGAGKTTALNVCSGIQPPSAGAVHLAGRDVTRSGIADRARMGLSRTFQRMELFGSLTVRDNVQLGAEGPRTSRNPLTHLWARSGQMAEIRRSTERALATCGLSDIADRAVAELSTGERRLVELARALAAEARVLLLDEPASGLHPGEVERLAEILRLAAAEERIAILLVEHDVELVMDICDTIYVLDFGRVIFSGTPAETRASTIVRDAYLGAAT